jgi:two-component system, NtrC family, sensor histidine kinase PilS
VALPDAGMVGHEAGSWPTYWRSLRYFALSRLVVASVLIAYVPLLRGSGTLDDGFDPQRFLPIAAVYLAAALVFVALSRPGRVKFETLTVTQVSIDLIALAMLISAGGGVRGGLAILLILPNAGAAILMGARTALFFAAMSTLMLLGETGDRWLEGEVGEFAFVQSGLIGAALLATVLIVNRLAARLEAQELLAWRRGEDLRNQLAVTQAVISELQDGVVVLGERGELRAINRSAREMLAGLAAGSGAVAGAIEAVVGEHGAEPGAGTPLPGLLPLRAALGLRSPAAAPPSGSSPRAAPADVATEAVEFTVPGLAGAADRRIRARRLGVAPVGADSVVVLEDLGRLELRAQQLKLASMGRLSASIAHEIRNPLAAIRHANGLLAEQLDGRHLKRLATIVEDNCMRLNRIIEDVLSISRRGTATPEPLPAADFLSRTVAEYVSQSGADARRVECRVASDAPIWFDAGNLRQVLLNLLANALRYAGEGAGAVRIEWDAPVGGVPALTVSDDGPGIAAASRVHLFEPFFTTESRGTGLGLHLARELCTANGATIRYRPAGDNPPLRSAFVVEPLRPPADADR